MDQERKNPLDEIEQRIIEMIKRFIKLIFISEFIIYQKSQRLGLFEEKMSQKLTKKKQPERVPVLIPEQIEKLNLLNIQHEGSRCKTNCDSFKTRSVESNIVKNGARNWNRPVLRHFQDSQQSKKNKTNSGHKHKISRNKESQVKNSHKQLISCLKASNHAKKPQILFQAEEQSLYNCCLLGSQQSYPTNPLLKVRRFMSKK